jgi:hypothetical protein
MRTLLGLVLVLTACGATPTPSGGDAGPTDASNDGADATPTCGFGFADCDGNQANGCEVFLAQNAMNCGACGTVCTEGLRRCRGGICSP